MDEYLKDFKNRKNKKKEIKKNNSYSLVLTKILLGVIFFLVSIIFTNTSDKNLLLYKDYVFQESLPFTKIKKSYENLFGSVLPQENNAQPVFNNKLIYKDIEDYKEGSKLLLDSNTLISNIASGIVVFIGEKEGYGNTVIVQGIDGADIWYGNLTNVSVKLYDYLEKETVMGEVNGDTLYIVIKKDNEYIKYEDYQV